MPGGEVLSKSPGGPGGPNVTKESGPPGGPIVVTTSGRSTGEGVVFAGVVVEVVSPGSDVVDFVVIGELVVFCTDGGDVRGDGFVGGFTAFVERNLVILVGVVNVMRGVVWDNVGVSVGSSSLSCSFWINPWGGIGLNFFCK